MEVKFIDVDEIDRLIDGLSAEQKEELAAKIFSKLSPESKAKVLGLSDAGITVVTGSFVSLNSEVAVNIQNSSSGFDAETIIKAMLEYRKNKK